MSTPIARAVADIAQPSTVLSARGLTATVVEGPESRSAFMSLLASMLPANDLETLTSDEFNALISTLAGEVMSNQRIHSILKDRAREAIKQLRSD